MRLKQAGHSANWTSRLHMSWAFTAAVHSGLSFLRHLKARKYFLSKKKRRITVKQSNKRVQLHFCSRRLSSLLSARHPA